MDYNLSNANEVIEAVPLEVWIEEDAIDINDI
jgi:hypothetical protein